MVLAVLSGILAQAQVPDDRAKMLQTFGLMAFMAIAMYLLMFRPQQKKAREHSELLKNIKNGDRVVTSGGIIGVVVGIKDKSVSIRSADTKLEILKSSVAEILERSAAQTSSGSETAEKSSLIKS
jgi:preprotein translocase subunit YajC